MAESRQPFVGTITGGDIEQMNLATLEYPGDLGRHLPYDGGKKRGQIAKLDSGATSATGVGAPAATQLAFWKDRAQYIVTNDLRFSSRNQPAGVFRGSTLTAGRHVFIQQGGPGVDEDGNAMTTVLAESGGTYPSANGDLDGILAIANSGTAADITDEAAGTAPTYKSIGEIRGPRASGVVPIDLDIPPVE